MVPLLRHRSRGNSNKCWNWQRSKIYSYLDSNISVPQMICRIQQISQLLTACNQLQSCLGHHYLRQMLLRASLPMDDRPLHPLAAFSVICPCTGAMTDLNFIDGRTDLSLL